VDDAGDFLALDKTAINHDDKGFFPVRMNVGRREPEEIDELLAILWEAHGDSCCIQ
jgi:hypothetical protein